MKNRFSLLIIGLIAVAPSYVLAGGKADPFLGVMKPAFKGLATKGLSTENEVQFHSVLIKTTDIETVSDVVRKLGGRVRLAFKNLISAEIPDSSIETLIRREDVLFIEAAKPMTARNDLAMTEINADEVHAGSGLAAPFTGRNTIIGIVDAGIDYTHPDFKDADGKNRIIYVWNQTAVGKEGPKEIDNTYGVECNADDIADNTCPADDKTGHGTHITGIAAGRNEVYGGVAPEAKIIEVVYKAEIGIGGGYINPVFSTTICEGAYYIFKKAKELGLPAVVNLSLGTHIGPHDGTSLFEECLDSLVEGSSGRAIVAAAGNETVTDNFLAGLHAGHDVNGESAANFVVKNFAQGRIFYLDIWGDPDSDLQFGLALNSGVPGSGQEIGNSELIGMGHQKSGRFLNGQIAYQINTTDAPNPLNGKPHVGITIVFSDTAVNPDRLSFDLLVSGTGHFNAWLYPDKPADSVNFTSVSGIKNGREYFAGDGKMSVASPATAKNVIGVSAYVTRDKWEHGSGCCRLSDPAGQILSISSSGPSVAAELGQKPEIAAPGAMIASSLSSDALPDAALVMPDGRHVLMAGTSMAAPFVAGTAALIFEANPEYTFADVENIITESAYVDDYTGAVPNDRWGFGKLDVLTAMERALEKTPSSAINKEFGEISSAQAPASCSIGMNNGRDKGLTGFIFVLAVFCLLISRRRAQIS